MQNSKIWYSKDDMFQKTKTITDYIGFLKPHIGKRIEQVRKEYGKAWSKVFRTITCDNGSEFSSLPELFTDTKIYYAHPYSAWERGTNEKQNSLIRRFFPKI